MALQGLTSLFGMEKRWNPHAIATLVIYYLAISFECPLKD
nr:MAG TPA: hypothetical protein [Caudoviricetes sp.]